MTCTKTKPLYSSNLCIANLVFFTRRGLQCPLYLGDGGCVGRGFAFFDAVQGFRPDGGAAGKVRLG